MQLGLTTKDFKDIKSGLKTVEVRAPSDSKKYRELAIGEPIEFTNESTNEKLTVQTTFVRHYPTAVELYTNEGVENINPGLTTEQALEKLNSIPTYKERIEKDGVYAIGIKIRPPSTLPFIHS